MLSQQWVKLNENIGSNMTQKINTKLIDTTGATDGSALTYSSSGGLSWLEPAGGGVTTYATIAELPLSGNDDGSLAFVSGNNRLYIWNGAGWFNIAMINTSPSITTGPDASYAFAVDGTPIVLTLVAEDPEGVPITWSYAVTTGSLGSTATVSQSDNVFTITPSTSEAGAFGITFTASDGINLATAVSSFSLSFSPSSIEYLIVAGGGAGGGGTHNGGGGGAGGLLTGTTSITPQTYVITIGSGGLGNTGHGANGSNSSAFSLTAIGGGSGGSTSNIPNGSLGGSGGGGSQGGAAGGAGTAGQGFGGAGAWYAAGGGGGGAGYAVASGPGNSSPYTGGLAGVSGGDGISSSISGIATYYAGGGGGGQRNAFNVPQGLGGEGGGGNGGTDPGVIGFAGAPNTGGGGGGLGGNLGAGSAGTGGDGGSGIVIIRYPHTFIPAQATTGSTTYTVSDGYRIYTFTSSGSITF